MENKSDKKISLEEQKKIMLEILIYVDEFCRKNDITYYLIGGSLIGAVRHKGFIPWDDDIDIAMRRDDYEKFVDIFNNNDSKKYQVLTKQNKKGYYLPYAKIIDNRTFLKESVHGIIDIGVNIDVFPMDYVSEENRDYFFSVVNKLTLLERIILYKSVPISKKRALWKNIVILALRVLCPIPYSYNATLREKRMRKCASNQKCKWIANLYGAWGQKEITLSNNFSETLEMEFEGKLFFVPVGYDEFLKNVYGDYMKLPPQEKRITHHSYQVYWKNC